VITNFQFRLHPVSDVIAGPLFWAIEDLFEVALTGGPVTLRASSWLPFTAFVLCLQGLKSLGLLFPHILCS